MLGVGLGLEGGEKAFPSEQVLTGMRWSNGDSPVDRQTDKWTGLKVLTSRTPRVVIKLRRIKRHDFWVSGVEKGWFRSEVKVWSSLVSSGPSTGYRKFPDILCTCIAGENIALGVDEHFAKSSSAVKLYYFLWCVHTNRDRDRYQDRDWILD